ncbi:MAG TPA: response regulator [Candidatus Wunengus sp. YC60]|uniref:response regulator n=1 Tax=Candidatus Wunengus sp. YC60 TaxID=3367697 RepID=UPI00402943DF
MGKSINTMDTKILLAADKLEKYGDIVGHLGKNGFSCIITAADGNEVLKHLDGCMPDFAILDANLPVLDGFQLCKLMKSAEFKRCENIPVVLLSETFRTSMASELAKSVGAYGILHAPFAVDDLLFLIYNKLYPERIPVNKAGSLKYKAKVMIADDDADIVRALKDYVSAEGYEVSVAQDGQESIHMLGVEKPQILFLNCDIPKLSGRDILKWIKETIPEIVVIVMIAHGSEFMAVELLKAGASDYIIKPFDSKVVSEICEDALRRYNINLINKREGDVELKLLSMVDGMVDGVILLDTKGRPTLVNKAGKETLKCLDIKKAEDDSIISINNITTKEIYDEIFIKKQRYISFEINTKGDSEKYFVIIASAVTGFAGENIGVVIVLRDVTREYQLQYQVIKSEKLYAVSNLIAGAAHELNNPLAGIQLCTDLVVNEPSISEKAKKYLGRIQKETEQIQGVIKSLLTFTGNYTLSKEHVDINEIIEDILRQKSNQFDHSDIRVVKLIDEKLPAVFVDKHQIKRVFLNIIENASSSMEGLQSDKSLTVKTEGNKELVKITISDTGPGIPKEHLAKIFEPFFTAREYKKSKGVALGLSVAYSIVHQHNGRVYAKSESGSGATFVIELPLR